MANGWTIDKSTTRRRLIAAAQRHRYHFRAIPADKIRVSESALAAVNAATERFIDEYAQALPSKGQTIK